MFERLWKMRSRELGNAAGVLARARLVRPRTRVRSRARSEADDAIAPEAQKMAAGLHYAPLPGAVVSLVQARLPTLKASGKAIAAR